MIRYVEEYGHISFTEKPLNHVDSLVLSQFCYLKFDGIVPELYDNSKSVILKRVGAKKNYEALFQDDFFEKNNRMLLEAMKKSKRFGSIRMNNFINVTEKDWETQFSAVTFLLDDGTVYIAFRGTDMTIVGWKEDFNMTFMDTVPGQAYSVKYLNVVATRFRNKLYLGGHSKGGHLAVYGAVNCMQEVQDRILAIYSMDGPGIRKEILKCCEIDKISKKIIKILPHSSLIGLLFEEQHDFLVVESSTIGLLQHDPYSWVVKEDQFKIVDKVFPRSRHVNETLSLWLTSLSTQERKKFVDVLYSIVQATEEDNIFAIASNWKQSIFRMKYALDELDEETETMLKEILFSLIRLARIRVKQSILDKASLVDAVQDAIAHQE